MRGVFCPVTETMARLQSERREQALRCEAETAQAQAERLLERITKSEQRYRFDCPRHSRCALGLEPGDE